MESSYSDIPTIKTREDYDVAINEVVNLFKIGDVVSIYRTGSIRALGLSDIDLILVLKDKPVNAQLINDKINFYMIKFRYFFQHVPVIVNESSAHLLKKVYPLFDFELLHGKNLDLKGEFTKNNSIVHLINEASIGLYNPAINVIIGEQNTPIKKFFGLNNHNKQRDIKVRYTLARISSFKYINALYHKVTSKSIVGADSFQDKIDGLRKNWFDLENEKRIEEMQKLSKTYVGLSINFLDKFDSYLKNKEVVSIGNLDNAKLILFPRINYYASNWSKEKCFSNMESIYEGYGDLVGLFPLNFIIQPAFIGNSKYFFDAQTRKKIKKAKIKYLIKDEFIDIQDGAELINNFVIKHRLKGKMFSKFYISGNKDKTKRLIASYLFNQKYKLL